MLLEKLLGDTPRAAPEHWETVHASPLLPTLLRREEDVHLAEARRIRALGAGWSADATPDNAAYLRGISENLASAAESRGIVALVDMIALAADAAGVPGEWACGYDPLRNAWTWPGASRALNTAAGWEVAGCLN